MNLAEFHQPESIFIDANIFVYAFSPGSPYEPICRAFLQQVEARRVQGVISTLVVDEVAYALLMHKGSQLLQTTRLSQIKQRLTSDSHLAQQCYAVVALAMTYLERLQQAGLRVVEVPFALMTEAVKLGAAHHLLPRDAMHYAVCRHHRILHLASRDAHFQRLPHLCVWSP